MDDFLINSIWMSFVDIFLRMFLFSSCFYDFLFKGSEYAINSRFQQDCSIWWWKNAKQKHKSSHTTNVKCDLCPSTNTSTSTCSQSLTPLAPCSTKSSPFFYPVSEFRLNHVVGHYNCSSRSTDVRKNEQWGWNFPRSWGKTTKL